jgi:hypothetical protein
MRDEQMKPPWLQFPEIKLGSLGWRMGDGEDYWYSWQDWYVSLSEEARSSYREKFPEPPSWEGFYERTIAHQKNRIR